MLEEEAALLEEAEEFQVAGSKYKKVTTGDEKRQWPSKKAKGKQQEKYCRGAAVKMRGANLCEKCVSARQDCLVYPQGKYFYYTYYYYFLNNFLLYSLSQTSFSLYLHNQ